MDENERARSSDSRASRDVAGAAYGARERLEQDGG